MSKSIVDKAHIQQSLASRIWRGLKRHFQKTEPHDMHPIHEASVQSIQHDLALVEEENHVEFEVEMTLDELQNTLALLEKQNQQSANADEALKQLIDTLKKSEALSEKAPLSSFEQKPEQKPEVEVVIEFIPLPDAIPSPLQQPKPIYREIKIESMSDKIKREKEQRELAKRITHYPPSDRLH